MATKDRKVPNIRSNRRRNPRKVPRKRHILPTATTTRLDFAILLSPNESPPANTRQHSERGIWVAFSRAAC